MTRIIRASTRGCAGPQQRLTCSSCCCVICRGGWPGCCCGCGPRFDIWLPATCCGCGRDADCTTQAQCCGEVGSTKQPHLPAKTVTDSTDAQQITIGTSYRRTCGVDARGDVPTTAEGPGLPPLFAGDATLPAMAFSVHELFATGRWSGYRNHACISIWLPLQKAAVIRKRHDDVENCSVFAGVQMCAVTCKTSNFVAACLRFCACGIAGSCPCPRSGGYA